MIAYVFGYGSLLERASRTRTNPDAIGAWPARVTGYQRGWFHQFADNVGSTCTYSGAIEAKGKTVNGVIYKVSDFENTKARETGYTATPIKADQLTMLDGGGKLGTSRRMRTSTFSSAIKTPISKTKGAEPQSSRSSSLTSIFCHINGCLELDARFTVPAKGFYPGIY